MFSCFVLQGPDNTFFPVMTQRTLCTSCKIIVYWNKCSFFYIVIFTANFLQIMNLCDDIVKSDFDRTKTSHRSDFLQDSTHTNCIISNNAVISAYVWSSLMYNLYLHLQETNEKSNMHRSLCCFWPNLIRNFHLV